MRLDWSERKAAIARLALSQLACSTDTGAERAEIAVMLAGLREDAPMDGYDRLEVLIRSGTTIDGAVVALCPAEDGTVVADVCIDGPPVP